MIRVFCSFLSIRHTVINSTVRGIIPDKEAVMTLWALQPCKRSPSFILTGRLTGGVTDRLYQKEKALLGSVKGPSTHVQGA